MLLLKLPVGTSIVVSRGGQSYVFSYKIICALAMKKHSDKKLGQLECTEVAKGG